MKELKYSSGLNGASFLMFELKQVINLKIQGFSPKEIRQKVVEENIFQFENKGRINRSLPSIMRRADAIDMDLAIMMNETTIETSKIINLYAIMKTDLLFFEFMEEVISEKFRSNNYFLEKKDVNLFFEEKAEQNETVASWSNSNLEKLKRSYMQVLYESGILQDRKGTQINRIYIDDNIKKILIHIGDHRYVSAMGE